MREGETIQLQWNAVNVYKLYIELVVSSRCVVDVLSFNSQHNQARIRLRLPAGKIEYPDATRHCARCLQDIPQLCQSLIRQGVPLQLQAAVGGKGFELQRQGQWKV